jgi:hypothetical protein
MRDALNTVPSVKGIVANLRKGPLAATSAFLGSTPNSVSDRHVKKPREDKVTKKG